MWFLNKPKAALCFIISYDHVLQQEELWREWIEPNMDILNIYFHCKLSDAVKTPFVSKYTIPSEFTAETTYADVTPAYMASMFYARSHDVNNQWFCMLTDSCVPILSPLAFRKLFLAHYGKSIIRVRAPYWNIYKHTRGNLNKLPKHLQLTNDPWFIFSRYHVNLTEQFLSSFHKVYNIINGGGIANESLFAIVLQTYNQVNHPKTHLNEVSTIADWSRMASATSPFMFKNKEVMKEMHIIQKLMQQTPEAMFLRKVHFSFPKESLKLLWKMERTKDKEKEKEQQQEKETQMVFWGIFGGCCCCLGILVYFSLFV